MRRLTENSECITEGQIIPSTHGVGRLDYSQEHQLLLLLLLLCTIVSVRIMITQQY